jgi:hypothetical protein
VQFLGERGQTPNRKVFELFGSEPERSEDANPASSETISFIAPRNFRITGRLGDTGSGFSSVSEASIAETIASGSSGFRGSGPQKFFRKIVSTRHVAP